jgi:predicted ester cyclase
MLSVISNLAGRRSMIFYNVGSHKLPTFVQTTIEKVKPSFKKTMLMCWPLFFGVTARAQSVNDTLSQPKNDKHMTAAREAILHLYHDILNERKLDELDPLISVNYHGQGGRQGLPGFQQPIKDLLAAFPDAHWEVQVLLAGEDKVFLKQTFEGTQTGLFQNILPTKKHVVVPAMVYYEFKDGKIIESEIQTDRLSFLQQLGVIPTDLSKLPR